MPAVQQKLVDMMPTITSSAEIVVFIMNYFNVSLTAKDFKIERVILGEYEMKHLRVSRVINNKEQLIYM